MIVPRDCNCKECYNRQCPKCFGFGADNDIEVGRCGAVYFCDLCGGSGACFDDNWEELLDRLGVHIIFRYGY